MRSFPRRAAARLRPLGARLVRDQSGYSLPELLTVMAVLPIVLSAVLLFTDKAQLLANNDTERSHTIRETQVGLDRITRELRQAHTLIAIASYRVEFIVRGADGLDRRVVHDCGDPDPSDADLKRCVRYEVASGGTETVHKPLISRVANQAAGATATPVFTYTPNDLATAKHVRVKVEVNARGARKEGYRYRVVLDDGVQLRNRYLAE